MKKNKDIIDEKKGIDKGFIIGFIASLIVCAFIAGIVIIQEIYGLNRNFNDNLNIILCDAFSISGLLLCLFYIVNLFTLLIHINLKTYICYLKVLQPLLL